MRIKPFGWFLIVALIAGLGYWGWSRGNNPQTSAPIVNTAAPAEGNAPTTGGQPNSQGNPMATAQPASDGKYPIECHAGTTLSQIDVAVDGYPGYYPVMYQVATMPASDKYCINLMAKWSGPDYDLHGYEEAQIEQMLRYAWGTKPDGTEGVLDVAEADGTGAVDVYFGTNGGLSLFDSRYGKIFYSPSGSTGADQIWALNSVASPFAKDGKPTFNDLLGRTIITSPGGADHFLTLRMMQVVGLTVNDVNIIYPESDTGNPVDNFCAGNGQFVAYWAPPVDGANCVPATLLLSTKWWRGAVTDYMIVSNAADTGMQDAIVYFLNDYNNATQAFTTDNLPATSQVLVNMRIEGNNMADWMFLDVNDPAGSLSALMDGVAIAKLSDNAIMFDANISGSSLAKEQIARAHNTWLYGGITGNGNGAALFDENLFVTDKYVEILLQNNARNVSGTFNNTYDTDVSQRPPTADENVLIDLPDWGTLPYKQIGFVEGFSNMLLPGEKEKVLEMAAAAAVLMNESDDSVLVIQGGMGLYAEPGSAQWIKNADFAYRRAQYIQKLLADELNIPIQRIILDKNVLLPTHPLTPEELPEYLVVIISMKNTQFK